MRAAIYVRQSLDKSGEGAAVARQLAECKELAGHNNWQITETYVDNDQSATTGDRPQWTRLLADLERGRHDVLVCWHTDRLYRRLRDLVDLVEIAEKRALRIASVKASDIDLSTPAGRMLAGMLGSAARYEMEQKGARQVAANRARAQSGHLLWTRRPYGFDRNGHDVFIVEAEAAEIRRAAESLLAGATLAQVTDDLNRRSVLTTLGNQWTVTTTRRMVLNPRVAGRIVYKGEDMGLLGPAILDEETHDRLTALLTDPRRKTAPSTAVKYLLSGLVLCGRDDCANDAMFATTNGSDRFPVYRCFKCYMTRRRDLVDELVTAVVVERLARPDAARLLSPDVDVSALQAQAVELRNRRDGLAAMLADGLLGVDSARDGAKKLNDRIEVIERQIGDALGESPLSEVVTAEDVAQAFHDLPLLGKREIIRALMDITILPAGKGVRFSPEQVQIDWKGAP